MKSLDVDTVMHIIAIVIIVPIVFLYNIEPAPELPVEQSAWDACITKASERMQIPRIQSKGYSPDDVTRTAEQYHYRVMIYSTDGYIYECDIANRWGNHAWYLKSLDVRLATGKGYNPLPKL